MTLSKWRWMDAVVFLLAGVTTAHAAAIVSQANLISASRAGMNSWQFTYQITVQNAQPALNAVTITVASPSSNGTIAANSTPIGNLAANASVSTTVTFQATGNQPGSNGDFHDSFWTQYLSQLMFEAIPGPGPVAQATITAANGGTISVADPGDPLYGTQVVFPPGALGDPSDTITIGYSNTLEAPLDPDAVAAGVIPVSKVVILSRLGTTPFKQDVMVTIPYSLAALGSQDYPVMMYWNPSLQQFEALEVTTVDRANGFVTFVTKHFSKPFAVGLEGLSEMLQGITAFPPQLMHVATSFQPQDEFEAQNFSTGQTNLARGGACVGLTSFAAWYFKQRSMLGTPPLYTLFQAKSDPGVNHLPQEDAVARELIARTFADTPKDYKLLQGSPILAASQFLLALLDTKQPQLAYLSNGIGTPAHSVLVLSFDAPTLSFSVYDPNVPYPQTAPLPFVWDTGSQSFRVPWYSLENSFTRIDFDAYGTHYDDADLQSLLLTAQSGSPPSDAQGPAGWNFIGLEVTSPLGTSGSNYPGDSSGPLLTVDSNSGTPLSFVWNCNDCVSGNYYLHVLQNNTPIGIPTGITPDGTSVTVTTLTFSGTSAELVSFVSLSSGISLSNLDQNDISTGYSAYQRAELKSGAAGPQLSAFAAANVYGCTPQGLGPQGYSQSMALSGSLAVTALDCAGQQNGQASLTYNIQNASTDPSKVKLILTAQMSATGTFVDFNPSIGGGTPTASYADVQMEYKFSSAAVTNWYVHYQGTISGLDFSGRPGQPTAKPYVFAGAADYASTTTSNPPIWPAQATEAELPISRWYLPEAWFCNGTDFGAGLSCLSPAPPETLDSCTPFTIPAGSSEFVAVSPGFQMRSPSTALNASLTVTVATGTCP
jgi:hypothetical protein